MLNCISHGNGTWVPSPRSASYTLSNDFLPNFSTSKHFWGKCGLKSLTHAWIPSGNGCSARYDEDTIALFNTLFHRKRVLFIGDSTQGQFFTSVVHTVGLETSYVSSRGVRHFQMCLGNAYEREMIVETKGGVVMQFVRHDTLMSASSDDIHRCSSPQYCPFVEPAKQADLIILNTGYHKGGNISITLAELHAIKNPHTQIIYRSLHSPACDGKVWPTNPKRRFTTYNHAQLEAMNEKTRSIIDNWNDVHYLNVWPLSNSNGQSRFNPPTDCVHQCMPGPIDEWSKLFLLCANAIRLQ
jgi:hypothetical protein